MPLAVEARLGPYKIRSLLGTGGMGEVYRAFDTRLKRDVALKIIQIQSDDANRLRRFEQEARAASSLTHPNIVTIHDFSVDGGVAYLVMELVEGQSLRKLLQSGELSKRKALDIAVQIADGLAAAHEAGIVHRDLKPENIMLTRDGRVKILDFGLAKPVDEELAGADATFGNNETSPGLLIGTTAYMSPEQARGSRVNHYSDQFAFGLILFELLTGRSIFRRDTPLQTLSAILTEEAPELPVASVPLQWLVRRCLHKEPDHRYRSTIDLLRELQHVRDSFAETTSTQPIPSEVRQIAPPPRRRKWIMPVAAVVAAIGCAAAGYFAGRTIARKQAVTGSSFVPLTRDAGIQGMAAWSPNGKTFAYSGEADGVLQILVGNGGASDPVQITSGSEDCVFPFWSPDGSRVYYISRHDGLPALWTVSAAGGLPELVSSNVSYAHIASDGHTLGLIRQEEGSSLHTLWMGSLRHGNFQRIKAEPLGSRRFLAGSFVSFSPDGERLGAWLSLPNGRSEFWSIPVREGEPSEKLKSLASTGAARPFSWLPDRRAIVFSDAASGSGSHLFRADLTTGWIVKLSGGTTSEMWPSVSRDGKSVLFTAANPNYDLVEITPGGEVRDSAATPAVELSPTSWKQRLAFVSDRRGSPGIWLRDGIEVREVVRRSTFAEGATAALLDPVFSPDGERIAFRRVGPDGEAIWISPVGGDTAIRLAREPDGAFQRGPSWSPDGSAIVYFSVRNGQLVILRARVGSLDSVKQIAANIGAYPRWSPKGDRIATIRDSGGLTVLQPDGAMQNHVGSDRWLVHGWAADGQRIHGVVATSTRRLALVELDVRTGNQSTVADLGPLPAAFAYGSAIGWPVMDGWAMLDRSFLTSMLRLDGDVWSLQID